VLARAHLRRATNIELRMQRYVRGYREDRIGERPFPYPILGGGNVLKMVERAKRGVRSNRSLISHRFHAWCCQAAVLVAIAIPVFTAQLEKSRESTDAANIRNAYAEIIVDILDNPGGAHTHAAVAMKQRQAGWQNAEVPLSLQNLGGGGTTYDGDLEITVDGEPTGSESATTTFTYTAGTADANPTLTITIG